MHLVKDSFISTNMIMTIFGRSPVLHNISPEYDHARYLVYHLFMTNLSLHVELSRLFQDNIPKKHEIN